MDVIEKIKLWTLEGRRAGEIAALLGDGWDRHKVARIKERHGFRTIKRAYGEYTYEPKGWVAPLGTCPECGADTSTACPVPRCSRYTGEVIVDRTMFGVSSGW